IYGDDGECGWESGEVAGGQGAGDCAVERDRCEPGGSTGACGRYLRADQTDSGTVECASILDWPVKSFQRRDHCGRGAGEGIRGGDDLRPCRGGLYRRAELERNGMDCAAYRCGFCGAREPLVL